MTPEGVDLGQWFFKIKKSRESLPPKQLKLMETLGVEWETASMTQDDRWDQNFDELVKFKANGATRACARPS